MDRKPDISGLGRAGGERLHHGAVAGQSPDDLAGGGLQCGSFFVDYGVLSSPSADEQSLTVSAALPTGGGDAVYLVAAGSRNGSPDMVWSSGATTPSSVSGDKKHMCAICGDRASGKHYGVHSCEGCKGFFKRTVRKDLHYACRDDKNCVIDRRQRNRCQYCRYQKCIDMGMKREAVQEERMGAVRDKPDTDIADSMSTLRTSGQTAFSDLPIEKLLEAEMASEPSFETYAESSDDAIGTFCHAAEKQLYTLVDWAKRIPFFTELPIDDQVTLLRSGWNELLIAGFSHRSISVQDAILLATGLCVNRDRANEAGIGSIFDRVMVELIAKMREMKMDKTELGCLRAIVLYNPDAKGLSAVDTVEKLREKVYAALDEYCRRRHPEEPGRFAKLLLRLPALRSIGLKCIEHLFFYKLVSDTTQVDTFLIEMLDIPTTSGVLPTEFV